MKKKLVICLAATLVAIGAYKQAAAQTTNYGAGVSQFDHLEVNGETVKGNTYSVNTDISGSPYLNDDWVDGIAVSNNGEAYKVRLKLDLYKNLLLFAGKDDNDPMTFSVPISKFTMGKLKFLNGFPAFDKFTSSTYYQILNEGNTELLKRDIKIIQSERDVSGVVVKRSFESNKRYFVFKNGKMAEVNPNKNSISKALDDKPQMVDYIKSHKINFKDDNDLAALFNYYNTL